MTDRRSVLPRSAAERLAARGFDALDALGEIALAVDASGTITRANALARARLGADDGEDPVGRPLAELLELDAETPVSADELARRLDKTIESARRLGSVHCLLRLDLPEGTDPDWAGRRLRACVRASDTVAWLAPGRLAALLTRCPLGNAQEVARQAHQHLAVGGRPPFLAVVPFTAEVASVDRLLARAEHTADEARTLDGRCPVVFRAPASDADRRRLEVVSARELLDAMDSDRLCLHAQPIVDLRTDRVIRFELLLRLLDGEGELVPPSAFVQAAETYDLAPALDRWVIREALRLLDQTAPSHSGLAVNLSARSLADPAFLPWLETRLAEVVEPRRLCFEITETAAIGDLERAQRTMAMLRGRGCLVALDDYGAGHSSFHILRHLQVDEIKIDGALVQALGHDPFAAAALESISGLAYRLGLTTVAEWVEDPAQVESLMALGIDAAQGFAFGHPSPVAEPALTGA